MQQGINIDEVKKYNASLREYKEKSSQLRAELEFSEKELIRQCAELTAELGIQVTPENIKTILSERISKINNTMEVGNEILNRIKAEEAGVASMQSQIPTAPQAQTTPVQVQQPVAAPTFETVGGTAPVAPGFPDMSGGLPPIFANNQKKIDI